MLSRPVPPAEPTKLARSAEAPKPATTGEAKPAATAEAKPAAIAEEAGGDRRGEAGDRRRGEARRDRGGGETGPRPLGGSEAHVATADAAKPASPAEVTKPDTKEPPERRGPLVTEAGAPAPTQPPPLASPPNTPASAALQLKPGAVKMIQQRLAIAGVLPEVQSSGVMDPPTRAALMRYQQANGLPVTGEPDDATIRKRSGLRSENIFEP